MPVIKDKDGRRSVAAETEVPGSPEEVWQAIATGQGISSWFVPSEVDGRAGGTTVTRFGPGMDAVATIKEWNPPHSFTAESEEEPGLIATEWTVEACDSSTCRVRVVHRWFADSDDWDGQFEGHAYGWATSFFFMLRLYRSHFPGQRCSTFQLTAFTAQHPLDVWRTMRTALGIENSRDSFVSAPGTPGCSGVVERLNITDPDLLHVRETAPQVVAALDGMMGEEPEFFLRLDSPAPGLAHIMIIGLGEQTMISLRIHLYGDAGAAVADETEKQWASWLAQQFPQEATA